MYGVLAKQPSFNRASNLCGMVENDLPEMGGPNWFHQKIGPDEFPEAKHEDLTLWLWHLEDCGDYLIGRPDLSGEVIFGPEVILADNEEIQIINEMPTGKRWHQLTCSQEAAGVDPDAALGGILLGSNKTHLMHYAGDVKVHALYMSLGNIKKDIRSQTSKRAWMLITHCLFHFCMETICQPLKELNVHKIIDPDGNSRLIFYVLLAYLADLEEQYLISALDKSN
ncbi:Zn-finger protein laccaria bicolor-like protein, putative [Rhizoctonia solani AG-3 Rhs1AP]|nr:Zn-finger protein laccaria bicolor-like protein, putative [Rhizoctonia solani AG-3 Rhs1AP]